MATKKQWQQWLKEWKAYTKQVVKYEEKLRKYVANLPPSGEEAGEGPGFDRPTDPPKNP